MWQLYIYWQKKPQQLLNMSKCDMQLDEKLANAMDLKSRNSDISEIILKI